MPVTDSTVAKFWAKFAADATALKAVPTEQLGTSKLYGALSDQLCKCHNRLKLEIDTAVGHGDWTAVISADGEERLFKFVEQVAAAAPPIPGWQVRAFRSRTKVTGSRITFGPHDLCADDILTTVTAGTAPGRVAVVLYVVDLDVEPGLGRAAEILFQHAIGEYDAVKVVESLRVLGLSDPPPAGAVPLPGLPAVVDRAIGRG